MKLVRPLAAAALVALAVSVSLPPQARGQVGMNVLHPGPDPRKSAIFDTPKLRDAEESAYRFLARFVPQCGGMTSAEDFELLRLAPGEDGVSMVHVRQTYSGLPVHAAESIVDVRDDGSIDYFTDGFVRDVSVDPTPTLTEDDAADAAVEAVGCTACRNRPVVSLWVRRFDGVDHLAYRVGLVTVDEDSDMIAPEAWVDAHSGEILDVQDTVQGQAGPHQTSASAMYESGQVMLDTYLWDDKDGCSIPATYYLIDTVHHVSVVTIGARWQSPAKVPGVIVLSHSDSFPDQIETAISYNVGRAIEYIKTVQGRDNVDGKGGPQAFRNVFDYCTHLEFEESFAAIAHFMDSRGPIDNAFWSPNNYMAFGDGRTKFSPLVDLDTCTHELTHGVTQYSSGLTYSGESGALNESFSDVVAAAASDHYGVGERFAIGEMICMNCPRPELRSMQTPHNGPVSCNSDNSNYPDHVSEQCTGPGDHGKVHYNSSIPNHAFYLVSVGGTHHLSHITVPTLGIVRAARIWWVAFTTHLTPNATFADARAATLAVVRLSGVETDAIDKAWRAVGVGGPILRSPKLKGGKKLAFAAADSYVDSGAVALVDGYEAFRLGQSANGKSWTVGKAAKSQPSGKTVAQLFSDGDQHVVTIRNPDGSTSPAVLLEK